MEGATLWPMTRQGTSVDVFRTPLLTARDTARFLAMPESTLDRWLATPTEHPLVHGVVPEKRGWPRIPFVGIVEAYVLRSLRDLGLPLRWIEDAARLVREEFDDPYALARQRLATDGVAVFVRMADESLVQAHDRQIAIRDVLDHHLDYITWDSAGDPGRLRLPGYPPDADVIIDPGFGWGGPVLADSKVSVEAIVQTWRAGETITGIAEEYELPALTVEHVLQRAA